MRTARPARPPLAVLLTILLLAAVVPAAAQTTSSPTSGVVLASQTLSALSGAAPLTAVKLTGEATYTAGSYADTGTITLEASGSGSSRVDLELAGGSRITVRGAPDPGSPPTGAVQASGTLAEGASAAGAPGTARTLPLGALWTPAVWFDPALALGQPGVGTLSVSDRGPATINAAPADRLRAALSLPHQSAAMTAEIASLSRADYDLDPATHLPLALNFTAHPGGVVNRDAGRVEIRYADWRRVSGVEIPYHIERWINGTRQLVIAVTSVEVNPALAAGEFQLGGAQ